MSLIRPNAFSDAIQLNAFLSRFGINLPDMPPFPISLLETMEYLATVGVDIRLIEKCINHVNRGFFIYGNEDRERADSHSWPTSLANELFWARSTPFIDRNTRIVSMGSCFAVEIAWWLQENKYNYIITERERPEGWEKSGMSRSMLKLEGRRCSP